VLDPETMDVTFLVIKEGVLFTVDKLVPIQYLDRQEGRRITLNKTAEELGDLPPYDESAYVGYDRRDYAEEADVESADAVYWYPPIRTDWWTIGGEVLVSPKPRFVKKADTLPQDVVALDEGAKVIAGDGNEIGAMEQVIVEPEELRATHIVVGRGLIAKEYKLLPTSWIKDVTEEKVYLSIHTDFFERLPEHEISR
jgi:hypothetical protein